MSVANRESGGFRTHRRCAEARAADYTNCVTPYRTTNRLILFPIIIENQSIRLEFLACVFGVHFCFPRMSRAGERRPGHWVTVAGRRVWEYDADLSALTDARSFARDDFADTGRRELDMPSWAHAIQGGQFATDAYGEREYQGWQAELGLRDAQFAVSGAHPIVDLGGGLFAPQAPGHYKPSMGVMEIAEFAGAVASGATTAAAAAEVAGGMLVEAAWHEAWHVASPLLPGDTKVQKLLNSLEMSVGVKPTFGTFRPDLTEGMTQDQKKAAWDKLMASGSAGMAGTTSGIPTRKP